MAAGDTIRLLTRYEVGAHSDPRENRLTAAVVALLTESPALASRVAQAWIGNGALEGPVAVRMQRPVGGNVGWVDFELVVNAPKRRIVWVEVKLGHRLSGENQLDKYLTRLKQLDAGADERLVLLLAPAQRREIFRDVPSLSQRVDGGDPGAYFFSWQELYDILARGVPRRGRRVHHDWLLREVLGHMAQEGLKASALTPQHVRALGTIDDALAARAAVIDRVDTRLADDGWKAAEKPNKTKDSYWEHKYQPMKAGARAPRGTRALLNWGVAGREAFAGVYFKRNAGGPIRPLADDQWRTALLQLPNSGRGEWEEDDGERNWIWIGRSKPLVDIAKHDTVDAQAYELADFVIVAFIAALAVHP